MTREELIEAIVEILVEAPGDYAQQKKAIERSKRIARLGPHNPNPGEAHASVRMYQKTLDKAWGKKKYARKMKHRFLDYPESGR